MPDEAIGPTEAVSQHKINLIKSDENGTSLEPVNYVDMYVLGKLWIDVLKIGLLGTKWRIIPVVEAAKPPEPPKKPPPMKYKDLPIYERPHFEYKDYMAHKDRCPRANDKLIHNYLLPYVKSYRKSIGETWSEFSTEYAAMKKDFDCAVQKKKNEVLKKMRDPENLTMRQVVLAMGGLTGYYLGSGKNIPKRLFFTGFGLLAAGALCFPKETDEAFRQFTYTTSKILIVMYNKYCGKSFSLREKIPCKDDLPPPPKPRKANYCPSKK